MLHATEKLILQLSMAGEEGAIFLLLEDLPPPMLCSWRQHYCCWEGKIAADFSWDNEDSIVVVTWKWPRPIAATEGWCNRRRGWWQWRCDDAGLTSLSVDLSKGPFRYNPLKLNFLNVIFFGSLKVRGVGVCWGKSNVKAEG